MAPSTKKPVIDLKKAHRKAKTLSEALPYMREFAGETFVIKYGGSAMGDPALAQSFARDVVLLKQVGINPVVVHGGGPQIGAMLEKLKIKSAFIDGLRVTDKETVKVVEMVLSGSINKQVVADINAAGGMAVGLSGKDGGLVEARKLKRRSRATTDSNIEKILDLGFVGEPVRVNPEVLVVFEESHIIPVIAPIAVGEDGETFNVNADTMAGAIASALAARKLILLTDVPGVLQKDKELISKLEYQEAKQLIDEGVISGGMIPKVETCLHAIEHNVEAAHILDGTLEHVLLLEIFTNHGTGTMISDRF
ncbi:MAG: acetylglutamate kinase [Rickettsiales bacterium]|nr:acetylglutamate kinase [Rickettsiales bacterium]